MKDKVVIITGTESGIGKAVPLLLSKKGVKIIIANVNETESRCQHENIDSIKYLNKQNIDYYGTIL